MPVEVKRKQNESTYGLLRRFQDKVKKSRAVILAKKRKHFEKPKSKRQTKKDALCRAEGRKKRAFLIKTGRLVEETMEMGRNKRR
jgi:ribosomal protein S21